MRAFLDTQVFKKDYSSTSNYCSSPVVFWGPTLVPLYTVLISIVLNFALLLSPLLAIPDSVDMMPTTQPLTLLAADPTEQLPPISNKQSENHLQTHYICAHHTGTKDKNTNKKPSIAKGLHNALCVIWNLAKCCRMVEELKSTILARRQSPSASSSSCLICSTACQLNQSLKGSIPQRSTPPVQPTDDMVFTQ